jgi:hypothetical protein
MIDKNTKKEKTGFPIDRGLFLFVVVGMIITFIMLYKLANAPPSDRPGFKDMGTYGDRHYDEGSEFDD